MIALSSDYLLFEMANGESVPLTVSMITVELVGSRPAGLDVEMVQQAANAVFYYFKYELGRQSMTVGEFAAALQKALKGLSPNAPAPSAPQMLESDLNMLASQSGPMGELAFFPVLRDELRRQLGQGPCQVRFRGLRGCVKQLAGAQRWGLRCSSMSDQIVSYLRECLGTEPGYDGLTLVVS